MTDEYGMSVDDFHTEPKRMVLKHARYPEPLPRANLILVREHLQKAMHAQPNAEAQKYIVLAIKEIER